MSDPLCPIRLLEWRERYSAEESDFLNSTPVYPGREAWPTLQETSYTRKSGTPSRDCSPCSAPERRRLRSQRSPGVVVALPLEGLHSIACTLRRCGQATGRSLRRCVSGRLHGTDIRKGYLGGIGPQALPPELCHGPRQRVEGPSLKFG